MRIYYLDRTEDETGISGTGTVAQAVSFSRDGATVLCWQTETPSAVFHPSIKTVEQVHSHNGKTRIVQQPFDPGGAFYLNHDENKYGLTRVGTVAEGIRFSNNWVALRWLVKPYTIEVHPSFEQFERIHNSQRHTYITPKPRSFKPSYELDSLFSDFKWYRRFAEGDWYHVRKDLGDRPCFWVRTPHVNETVFEIEAW